MKSAKAQKCSGLIFFLQFSDTMNAIVDFLYNRKSLRQITVGRLGHDNTDDKKLSFDIVQ